MKKKVNPPETPTELRDFERMFEDDKKEAEVRLAVIRTRIRTLERMLAIKEQKTWTLDK